MANSKIFTLPTYGNIDFTALYKKLKVDPDVDLTISQLNSALRFILDAVFSQYVGKVKFNERKKDGCFIWQMKRHECFIVVYLKNACISYTVRLNTVNFQKQMSCLYFSSQHMEYFSESLCLRVLRDFSRLIYECANLKFAFEDNMDAIPRGTYFSNKSWFSSEHEDLILTPMHYYEGYIDYKNKGFIPNKWDTWFKEIL